VNPIADYNPPPFEPISSFFGIWHEHRRGSHKGLHEFYFFSNYILLLNVHETAVGSYKSYKPYTAPIISPSDFHSEVINRMAIKSLDIRPVKAGLPGESCDQVRQVWFALLQQANYILCWRCDWSK
jgi:hypothetical protein